MFRESSTMETEQVEMLSGNLFQHCTALFTTGSTETEQVEMFKEVLQWKCHFEGFSLTWFKLNLKYQKSEICFILYLALRVERAEEQNK